MIASASIVLDRSESAIIGAESGQKADGNGSALQWLLSTVSFFLAPITAKRVLAGHYRLSCVMR
jgi:hypothetical protein